MSSKLRFRMKSLRRYALLTLSGVGIVFAAIVAVNIFEESAKPGHEDEAVSSHGGIIAHQPRRAQLLRQIDQAIEKMVVGKVVFNVPSPIDLDNSCPCQLHAVLSAKQNVAELQALIQQQDPDAFVFDTANIRISGIMLATLAAIPDDFYVTPSGDQERAVGTKTPATWTWTISPKSWGRHTLQLTIKAMVTVDGKTEPVEVTTLSRGIVVTVTPVSRMVHLLTDHWQWAWSALLVPIFGWVWKRFSGNTTAGPGEDTAP